tara:strand:- start:29910 stop:30233 length:324 start_codon:yes stop_codon:yes gene_type:complete
METKVNYIKSVTENVSLKEILENFLYRVLVIEDKKYPENNAIFIENKEYNNLMVIDPNFFTKEEKEWFSRIGDLTHKEDLKKAINILVSKGELRYTVLDIPDINKHI